MKYSVTSSDAMVVDGSIGVVVVVGSMVEGGIVDAAVVGIVSPSWRRSLSWIRLTLPVSGMPQATNTPARVAAMITSRLNIGQSTSGKLTLKRAPPPGRSSTQA